MRERRAVREVESELPAQKAPVSARTPRGELPAVPAVPMKSSRESDTRPPSMADDRSKTDRYMPSRGLFAQTLRADRHFLQEEVHSPRSNRVRGPAEVRAARAERPSSSNAEKPKDIEALPKEAKGADFRTLHEMIARGIIESETDASKMEAILREEDEEELRRHRELLRRQRAEAEEARQREREQARLKRQKEWDEQQRRIQLEMEREDEDGLMKAGPGPEQSPQHTSHKLRLQAELKAASRIQAIVRGRRSRRGHPTVSPVVHAVLHAKPFIRPTLDLE